MKSAKRVSAKVVTGITANQFDQAATDYAKACTKEQSIEAKMETAMTAIREKYAAELKELVEEQERNQQIMQAYCTENKEALFTEKKSLETAHLVIGFRTGTPKLVLLKGYNQESALQLVKSLLPKYIRKTEEINKKALLDDRTKPVVAKKLESVGLQVKQDESFYIEPKKEKTDVVAV